MATAVGFQDFATPTGGSSNPVKTNSTGQSAAPASENKGVYWVGTDGNVWFKSANGVKNVGAPTNLYDNGFDAATASAVATRIADPNKQVSNIGSGGSGSNYTDTSAARAGTQATIDSLGGIEADKIANINDRFNTILNQYNDENSQAKTAHGTQVTQNEQSREDGRQAALLAAAQGSRGLYATLAAMGALGSGGTGQLLANRAVSASANADIGGVDKNFTTNAENLINAWSATEAAQRRRETNALTARDNEIADAKQSVAEQRQSLLKDMASLWTQAGDNTQAANMLGQASSLTPQVANARRASAQYVPEDAAYTQQTLGNYLAGANDMTVSAAGGNNLGVANGVNNGIYAATRKRDELA